MSYYPTLSNAATESAPPELIGRAPGKRSLTDAMVARRAVTATATATPPGQLRPAPTACTDDPFALHLHPEGPAPRSAIARKAISLDSIEASLASGGAASFGDLVTRTPADVAAEGTRGSPQPIPHLAAMNESFGMDFSDVASFTDPRSCDELQAHAYATDNKVVFASADPAPSLVAHELSHVLDHTAAGPACRSDRGDDGGIDTSGEAQADAVEAAVAAGRPASSVLGDRVGARVGVGPARRSRGPALDSRLGQGMTFSPEGFELGAQYNIWSSPPILMPVPIVPGLNFRIAPSLTAKGNFGLDWKKTDITYNLGVEGGASMGFEYGNANLLAIYGDLEGKGFGSFAFQPRARPWPLSGTWNLDGSLAFSTNFKIGARVLGAGDVGFEFGKCEIGKLNGIKWEQGELQPGSLTWEWGEEPKKFFAMLNELLAKAREIGDASRDIVDDMVERFRRQWGIR